ncbi:hypothetical protein WA026_021322 [Henosepilachna vigintioctopunctata]|uniref:Uncharacterized protein n=1 Tax=Henosepilachna vigintioctopunctata TaxID=420089 RepID=A0AAW1U3N6_9CUCU
MTSGEEERKYTACILDGFIHLMNLGVNIDKFLQELSTELSKKKAEMMKENHIMKNKTNKRQLDTENSEETKQDTYELPKKTVRNEKSIEKLAETKTQNRYEILEEEDMMEYNEIEQNNTKQSKEYQRHDIAMPKQDKIPPVVEGQIAVDHSQQNYEASRYPIYEGKKYKRRYQHNFRIS